MAQDKICTLKINILVSKKKQIKRDSKECGFNAASKYILACVEAAPLAQQLQASQDIMQTFQRLVEFETAPRSSLTKTERRALATKIRDRLIYLCSDECEI